MIAVRYAQSATQRRAAAMGQQRSHCSSLSSPGLYCSSRQFATTVCERLSNTPNYDCYPPSGRSEAFLRSVLALR
jgi:hypothetical protein